MTELVYSVKDAKLKRSITDGFILDKENTLSLSEGTDYHMIALEPINGNQIDATWGRLNFSFDLPEDCVLITYVFASNFLYDETEVSKKSDFIKLEAKRFVSNNDILLYDITGKYLYVCIEITGEGMGNISNIRVDRVGDTFMDTFPDIYKDNNSFFHRYLSIFSSIYNDFGERIKSLPYILDADTCPANLLVSYGEWLGVDLNCDIRDEKILRCLVKEAYELHKIKGTKACVKRISKIMLGEDVTVLEKNIMEQFQDEKSLEEFKILFGDNVYNVCVLVDKMPSETLKSQYLYVLKQFIPLRAKISIVNLEKESELDYHSYLDMNAKLFMSADASLDNELALDHIATLN